MGTTATLQADMPNSTPEVRETSLDVPMTGTPQADMPTTGTPEVSEISLDMPTTGTSELSQSLADMPTMGTFQADIPSTGTPQVTGASLDMPIPGTPGVDMPTGTPGLDMPTTDTPQAIEDLPTTGTPQADMLATGTPELSQPLADMPATGTPQAIEDLPTPGTPSVQLPDVAGAAAVGMGALGGGVAAAATGHKASHRAVPVWKTATGPVAISHIEYKGTEYVLVTNSGSERVDLSGWVVRDQHDLNQVFRFPEGGYLSPGVTVQIFTTPGSPLSFNSKRPIMNDQGDVFELLNRDGQVVSTYAYGSYATGVLIAHVEYTGDEAITILNNDPTAADLSGWTVRDRNDANQAYRFPAGTMLASGESLKV
jgi:hypothetical protein